TRCGAKASGRLSTASKPQSSRHFSAVLRPAPARPVTMTRRGREADRDPPITPSLDLALAGSRTGSKLTDEAAGAMGSVVIRAPLYGRPQRQPQAAVLLQPTARKAPIERERH